LVTANDPDDGAQGDDGDQGMLAGEPASGRPGDTGTVTQHAAHRFEQSRQSPSRERSDQDSDSVRATPYCEEEYNATATEKRSAPSGEVARDYGESTGGRQAGHRGLNRSVDAEDNLVVLFEHDVLGDDDEGSDGDGDNCESSAVRGPPSTEAERERRRTIDGKPESSYGERRRQEYQEGLRRVVDHARLRPAS
jgi:hypothetical protein